MRYFVMGELMGGGEGMKCEASKDCSNKSWTIVLTDEESDRLPECDPENSSIHSHSHFIITNKLGVVTCKECRK